ncbi:MAG TPA: hypothetical protein VH560_14500 [Polyangia bacterium]|jgi:hypothetical protein|nr:hypothetical protein [Polyangia bacterium]
MKNAADGRGRLDVVDEVVIASPCTVSWDGMRGDDRVRFCGQCRQNVYNVEALDRGAARRLIEAREGRVCLRILRRDDGTVVTADCWTRLRAARRRGVLAFVAMLVVVGFAQLCAMRFGLRALGGGCAPIRQTTTMGAPPPPPLMGEPQPPRDTAPRLMGKRAASPPHVMGHRLMGRVAHVLNDEE